MAVTIKITKTGSVWVGPSKIGEVARGARMMRKTNYEVLDYIMKANKAHFNTRGHGTWKPLATPTIITRRREGTGRRILRETDRLYNSLTRKGRTASRDRDVEVSNERVYFASTVPYGGIHASGSTSKKIPKRKPMELTIANKKQIFRIIRRGLKLGR